MALAAIVEHRLRRRFAQFKLVVHLLKYFTQAISGSNGTSDLRFAV